MIQTNFDLKAYNTFGLSAHAAQYFRLESMEQLEKLELTKAPELVLGGGSNLLLMEHIPGLTLHLDIQGIAEVNTDGSTSWLKAHYAAGESAIVRAYAGVNWHQFVLHTLEKGLHGLENMALIPGTIGAAPVQNIGAYGAEVADFIEAVHVWEYGKGPSRLTAADCGFGYRDSYFKRNPDRYLITAVDFRLGGDFQPKTTYGAISDRLALRFPNQTVSPQMIARVVIEIRAEKLPFYSQLGNSGSFFKNPIVPNDHYGQLKATYPEMPAYVIDDSRTKIPAGWLIDQAGWKGKRDGAVGTFAKQALVIVNHGDATGKDVLAFSKAIQADVKERYGIELEREVRLIGQVK